MRGGGSWLPLFWLMVAFLVMVKLSDVLLPVINRYYREWLRRRQAGDKIL